MNATIDPSGDVKELVHHIHTEAGDLLADLARLLHAHEMTDADARNAEIVACWGGVLRRVTGALDDALGHDDARWNEWLGRVLQRKRDREGW